MYLIRKRGKSVAHIWLEDQQDTQCRMYSTGGLKQEKYKVVNELNFGRSVCQNCMSNSPESVDSMFANMAKDGLF